MHAPPKRDYPTVSTAELAKHDALLFGIPTRYGNFPAQWKVSPSIPWAVFDLPFVRWDRPFVYGDGVFFRPSSMPLEACGLRVLCTVRPCSYQYIFL